MNGKELYELLRLEENRYSVCDLGCGMLKYEEVVDGYWRTRYLLNTLTQTAYEIVGRDLCLKSFTPDDVDMESVSKFEYAGNASRMAAHYPFFVYPFKNGVAYVCWTLHPDGMYFMDDDGYGMEPCDEESIGAYIDTDCRVLVKFQDMDDEKMRKGFYEEALTKKGGASDRF